MALEVLGDAAGFIRFNKECKACGFRLRGLGSTLPEQGRSDAAWG